MPKYLTFSVGSELYGTSIIKVREIIRYEMITPIHDTLEYIQGVINLRGKIIPILDLRMKMGLEKREYNDKSVFIILDIQGENSLYNMGIAVDSVHEVIGIDNEQLESTPKVGLKLQSGFLEGIVRIEERMIMILDIDKIISSDDIIELDKITT